MHCTNMKVININLLDFLNVVTSTSNGYFIQEYQTGIRYRISPQTNYDLRRKYQDLMTNNLISNGRVYIVSICVEDDSNINDRNQISMSSDPFREFDRSQYGPISPYKLESPIKQENKLNKKLLLL